MKTDITISGKIIGGDSECNNSRNLTIDFIRGIAILLVVLGHNIQYGSGEIFYQSEGYFGEILFKIIYSFHMPLFALLSGYLFFWSIKKSVKIVLKTRLTSLLLPILCWILSEYIVKAIVLLSLCRFNIISFAHDFVSSTVYRLWFLWAIFWCSMIVLLVEKAFKGRVWIYGVIFGLLLFIPAKYNSQMYVYMYPYFVTGFLFNKFEGENWYDRVVKKDWIALAAAGVAFVVLVLFYGHDFYIYTTGINILAERGILVQLGIDIFRWIIGFVGSITVIILCKMICNKWNSASVRLFAYFGQISLGIYILNSYVNSYVLMGVTRSFTPNIFIWIIETVISMIVYAVVVEIIKKIPVAKKLLLGGR